MSRKMHDRNCVSKSRVRYAKQIGEMLPGEVGYAVPWAYEPEKGYLRLGHSVKERVSGTADMKVECVEYRRLYYVWPPQDHEYFGRWDNETACAEPQFSCPNYRPYRYPVSRCRVKFEDFRTPACSDMFSVWTDLPEETIRNIPGVHRIFLMGKTQYGVTVDHRYDKEDIRNEIRRLAYEV